MNNHRIISVVTPTLNSATTIVDTINSLISNSEYVYEWIIVDSYSSDCTLEIIHSYTYPFAIQILSAKPCGPYAAFNEGIKRASGQILSVLNSDDAWGSLVGRAVYNFYSDKSNSSTILYGSVGYIDSQSAPIGDKMFSMMPKFRLNELHPATFVPLSLYHTLGLYNVNIGVNADLDLLLRFYSKGLAFHYDPSLNVIYRRGGISSKVMPSFFSFFSMFFAYKLPVSWLIYSISRRIWRQLRIFFILK